MVFEIDVLSLRIGFLLGILILGAFLSFLGAWAQVAVFGGRRREETVEQRINRLTKSLQEAVQLVSQIEKEIESRHSLALKLRNDIETYKQIAVLKQVEIEAVVQLLRGELRKEGRRSFWENAALNFGFFVLGVVMSLVLTRIL